MINAQVDARGVFDGLTDLQERQFPFATALALNRTANLAQKEEQEQLGKAFKLRHARWIKQGVKIEKANRASKTVLVVTISVPPDRYLLDKFEDGESKFPHLGKYVWIPNSDVFRNRIITRDNPLNPHNLKFKERRGGQLIGTERTFQVNSKSGPIVLQRIDKELTVKSKRALRIMDLDTFKGGMGPARRKEKHTLTRTAGTRMLFELVSRTRTPAVLKFRPTIEAAVLRVWPDQMTQAMGEAMRTAR